MLCNLNKTLQVDGNFSLKSCMRIIGHVDSSTGRPMLHCNLFMPSDVFQFKVLRPLPILISPLFTSLMRLEMESGREMASSFGYLTLNQTRKVVFLSTHDSNVQLLPLVGVWVNLPASAVACGAGTDVAVTARSAVYHPLVWAACVRFCHNTREIKERVLVAAGTFLLVFVFGNFVFNSISFTSRYLLCYL